LDRPDAGMNMLEERPFLYPFAFAYYLKTVYDLLFIHVSGARELSSRENGLP